MDNKIVKHGIMLCGHGSRDKNAEMEFSLVVAGLKKRFPEVPIEYGFLDYSAPNIHMGLTSLVTQGVRHIYAVPGMLFTARHAKNDIPSVLTTFEGTQEGLAVSYGQELGLQEAMIDAFQARIYKSLGLNAMNLYDTMLVVVGRGTSDSKINAEVAKLTRIVSENMGFGWADTVYSDVTYPSVGVGLEKLLKLGYKRIVVAPYFLFTGRLIKRIYGYIDKVAMENPNVEFIKVAHLRDHKKVIDAFEFCVRETMQDKEVVGEDLMATFKRRLVAGEIDVHRHIYNDHYHLHPNTHRHLLSRRHAEPHSHSVYKHIAHPLGPRTMIGEGVCSCFMDQFPQALLDEERARIKLGIQGEALAHKS